MTAENYRAAVMTGVFLLERTSRLCLLDLYQEGQSWRVVNSKKLSLRTLREGLQPEDPDCGPEEARALFECHTAGLSRATQCSFLAVDTTYHGNSIFFTVS